MPDIALNGPMNRQWLGRDTMNKWAVLVFVFSVFSKEIGHATIFGIDYDLIGYNYCLFHILYYFRDLYLSRKVFVYYLILFFGSVTARLIFNYPMGPFWKQFLPILIIYSVNYDFFRRYDFRKLFELYYRIAYYTAIFGFIQLFAKIFLGLRLLTQFSRIFIDSVAYEPSHYVVIMMPAAIYGILTFRQNRWMSLVINGAVICTFTSTAIIGYTVMIALLFHGFFYLLLIIPVLYFVFTYYLVSIEFLNFRLQGFLNYLEYQNFSKVESATTISFLTNAEVAISSVKESPVVGVGLGGHESQYYKYFSGAPFTSHYLFGLNTASGHNLLIRLISETGLLGLFLYIRGLVKGLLIGAQGYNRMIALCCFSHFICKALKLGGYIDFGTPFFVMMMFFNYVDYKSKTS